MLFNSFVFLCVFLPITYAVFWCLRSAQARYVWLTLTGYVFYGYWDARFTLLMAFSTAVSFVAGLGLLRYTDRRTRRLCMLVPIVVDLLLLGFFKYTNFILSSADGVLAGLGVRTSLRQLDIILPVGISFYTFHTITYIVDAYRGTIVPTRNIFEFSAYVSLFSQLVAGPIVRFRQIEADLQQLGESPRNRWLSVGISFFVIGLFEKVMVADALAAFVDPALAAYETLSTAGTWLVMLGYSLQLYFDFAGYSDMAIGLGYMFGLRIPRNFDSPYKAVDPSDFWRRWHISLSSCLRDYLYVPLGGSRCGPGRTARNLMITMLIGGLWHGASWNFVVWGAYHGALLVLYRTFREQWNRLPSIFRQASMFVLVLIGWVFFRATDLPMALGLLERMFVPVAGAVTEDLAVFVVLAAFASWWAMAGPNSADLHDHGAFGLGRAYALAGAFGACIAVMAGGSASPFLYFQF